MKAFSEKKRPIIIAGVVLCVIGIWHFKANYVKRFGSTKMLLGTVVSVDVCAADVDRKRLDEAYEQVWKRVNLIQTTMSYFDVSSDIFALNYAATKVVPVQPQTYKILQRAMLWAEKTKYAFDPRVGSLLQLWDDAQARQESPDPDTVAQVQERISTGTVQFLPGNQVKIGTPGVLLTLGGIAKGYAVDEIARILRKNDFRDFYINAGGDVFIGGTNCKGELWRIGIYDPRDPTRFIKVVELTDRAITTSGDYEQFYLINGKKFSHIIDPRTGYPQEDVVSATVIAPMAQDADALSTALCVLSPQEGAHLIDALGDGYASITARPQQGTKTGLTVKKSTRFSRFVDR